MKRIALVLLFMTLLSTLAVGGPWRYYGEFNLPPAMTLPSPPAPDLRGAFSIAVDDARDLVYIGTTPGLLQAKTAFIARLNINTSDPKTTPSMTQIWSHTTDTADTTRGAYGLAVDTDADTVYVSGDASGGTIKFVDRIVNASTGSPTVESNWLAPTYRATGCDLVSFSGNKYLYVAELVGSHVYCYRVSDKTEQTPAAMSSADYLRDFVVDPTTYDIYAQLDGNLQRISGGNPGNMAGYAAGSNILTGDGLDMSYQALCRIGLVSQVSPVQVIWNTGPTGGAVTRLYETDLDGSPDKDVNLQPTDSPQRARWQAAGDSAALTIGAYEYLFVIDYNSATPRVIVFTNAPPPTPTPTPFGFAAARQWSIYE
jgi:hypothetical protein